MKTIEVTGCSNCPLCHRDNSDCGYCQASDGQGEIGWDLITPVWCPLIIGNVVITNPHINPTQPKTED